MTDRRIAAEMGVGVGTIYRVAVDGSKIRETVLGNKELTVSGNRSLITDTAMPAPDFWLSL